MNTTHQRLQALEGRNGCLWIQTHSHNHVSSLRSSGTFAGAGLNLSYRVLHPSGIGFGYKVLSFSSQSQLFEFFAVF